MTEDEIQKLHQQFDHLMARIQHDIDIVPTEKLRDIAQVLIQLMDFKTAMQNA